MSEYNDLAFFYDMYEGERCSSCNGHGGQHTQCGPRQCDICEGVGKVVNCECWIPFILREGEKCNRCNDYGCRKPPKNEQGKKFLNWHGEDEE